MSWGWSSPASMCFAMELTDRRRTIEGSPLPTPGPVYPFVCGGEQSFIELYCKKSLEGEENSGMELQVGSVLEGKVASITKFGAFVALEGGRSGLVHISEIANTFVNDVHDFLQEGQTVKVVVLSAEKGRINLSIKKALPPQERPVPRGPRLSGAPRPAAQQPAAHPVQAAQRPLPPSGDQAFEDKLKRFLSSSEGKMADLNRSMDGKRGGGRRRR